MANTPSLEDDTLFLACTRPAIIAGVTMEAMGVNIMLTTILYITVGSIAYALTGIVFHFLFRALVKHDHNMLTRIPTGRLGDPDDVAAVIMFLASKDAGFVNGAIIDVNGGEFAPS
ncbi:type IV secretory pathway VirB3-like protein [Rhizobium binae]|uniref:Type IV secretory pathway VirB3-like protein n=1 Tax=Rhizobium binae TaxID=1138190 RepID=A0ABV2MPL2_9HYPH|nr:SDR family oxidoreductase [Rhizobium binae]MBX4971004.1 SDR family oxidoreductase [Rhizobium binae]MBX4994957.1 SDR family oxidoreductase [Rhizobium binae]NKL52821.1 SDR family oxidoreductase [Rhizobium leguminosarum bv. viciae]